MARNKAIQKSTKEVAAEMTKELKRDIKPNTIIQGIKRSEIDAPGKNDVGAYRWGFRDIQKLKKALKRRRS